MQTTHTEHAVQLLTLAAMGLALGGELPAPLEVDDSGPEEEAEGDNRALKQILLGVAPQSNPSCLRLLQIQDAKELAAFIVISASLAQLNNQKQALADAGKGLTGPELFAAYEAFEATLAYQHLVRKSDGSFDCNKDGQKVPKAALSAAKLSKWFASVDNALTLAPSVDWASPSTLSSLDAVLSTRATHMAKLSGGGSGGFLKSAAELEPLTAGSVSEQDYLTLDTQSFACNAALQKYWLLSLSLISIDGSICRLPEALARNKGLQAEVFEVLTAAGAISAQVFIDKLAEPARIRPSGESQVFCGEGDRVTSLSVLTPFSLPREITRAKVALRRATEAEHASQTASMAAELASREMALESLKAQPKPKSAADKLAQAKERDVAQAQVREKAAEIKSVPKYLDVPQFTLLVGGSTPRNLAYGLAPDLHTANLFTTVHRRRGTHDLSRKTFYGKALVQALSLDHREMPSAMKSGSNDAADVRKRRELFANLCLDVLAPLCELQALYQQGARDEVDSLSGAAVDQTASNLDAWSLFVKGSETLNGSDLARKLEPLVHNVREAVKTSLSASYGKQVTNVFDEELYNAAALAVKLTCA